MSGSDQDAQNPWFRAKSRASSGHRGSLEISGMITRCFVNAAVPQKPLLGPIGQGVMAVVNAAGTWGPAPGNSCFPSTSIKQTIEVAAGAWASMAAHKSLRTSESRSHAHDQVPMRLRDQSIARVERAKKHLACRSSR